MKKLRWILWMGVVVVAAAATGFYVYQEFQKTKTQASPVSDLGGYFSLMDQDQHRRTNADFRGRHMMVYFGYTYCPDICPTALSSMSSALKALGSASSMIQPIFISVDGARDTPQQLKTYMQNFHPSFVALTGSDAEIEEAKRAYKVYATRVTEDGLDPKNYLLDHSSIIYIMDPKGRYVTHFSHETPAGEMAATLRLVLSRKGVS